MPHPQRPASALTFTDGWRTDHSLQLPPAAPAPLPRDMSRLLSPAPARAKGLCHRCGAKAVAPQANQHGGRLPAVPTGSTTAQSVPRCRPFVYEAVSARATATCGTQTQVTGDVGLQEDYDALHAVCLDLAAQVQQLTEQLEAGGVAASDRGSGIFNETSASADPAELLTPVRGRSDSAASAVSVPFTNYAMPQPSSEPSRQPTPKLSRRVSTALAASDAQRRETLRVLALPGSSLLPPADDAASVNLESRRMSLVGGRAPRSRRASTAGRRASAAGERGRQGTPDPDDAALSLAERLRSHIRGAMSSIDSATDALTPALSAATALDAMGEDAQAMAATAAAQERALALLKRAVLATSDVGNDTALVAESQRAVRKAMTAHEETKAEVRVLRGALSRVSAVPEIAGVPLPASGTVAFVVADLPSAAQRWAEDPGPAREAMGVYLRVARRAMVEHRGCEATAGAGTTLCCVFSDCAAAAAFCLGLPRLLVAAAAEPGSPQPLAEFSRPRFGVHFGDAQRNIRGDTVYYMGPAVTCAAALCAHAPVGTVSLSSIAFTAANLDRRTLALQAQPGVRVPCLGNVSGQLAALKGSRHLLQGPTMLLGAPAAFPVHPTQVRGRVPYADGYAELVRLLTARTVAASKLLSGAMTADDAPDGAEGVYHGGKNSVLSASVSGGETVVASVQLCGLADLFDVDHNATTAAFHSMRSFLMASAPGHRGYLLAECAGTLLFVFTGTNPRTAAAEWACQVLRGSTAVACPAKLLESPLAAVVTNGVTTLHKGLRLAVGLAAAPSSVATSNLQGQEVATAAALSLEAVPGSAAVLSSFPVPGATVATARSQRRIQRDPEAEAEDIIIFTPAAVTGRLRGAEDSSVGPPHAVHTMAWPIAPARAALLATRQAAATTLARVAEAVKPLHASMASGGDAWGDAGADTAPAPQHPDPPLAAEAVLVVFEAQLPVTATAAVPSVDALCAAAPRLAEFHSVIAAAVPPDAVNCRLGTPGTAAIACWGLRQALDMAAAVVAKLDPPAKGASAASSPQLRRASSLLSAQQLAGAGSPLSGSKDFPSQDRVSVGIVATGGCCRSGASYIGPVFHRAVACAARARGGEVLVEEAALDAERPAVAADYDTARMGEALLPMDTRPTVVFSAWPRSGPTPAHSHLSREPPGLHQWSAQRRGPPPVLYEVPKRGPDTEVEAHRPPDAPLLSAGTPRVVASPKPDDTTEEFVAAVDALLHLSVQLVQAPTITFSEQKVRLDWLATLRLVDEHRTPLGMGYAAVDLPTEAQLARGIEHESNEAMLQSQRRAKLQTQAKMASVLAVQQELEEVRHSADSFETRHVVLLGDVKRLAGLCGEVLHSLRGFILQLVEDDSGPSLPTEDEFARRFVAACREAALSNLAVEPRKAADKVFRTLLELCPGDDGGDAPGDHDGLKAIVGHLAQFQSHVLRSLRRSAASRRVSHRRGSAVGDARRLKVSGSRGRVSMSPRGSLSAATSPVPSALPTERGPGTHVSMSQLMSPGVPGLNFESPRPDHDDE